MFNAAPHPHVFGPFTPLDALGAAIQVESLTVQPDAVAGHFIARARIADLQPSQTVAAIIVIEDALRRRFECVVRTGWGATSDGLKLHFQAWGEHLDQAIAVPVSAAA